MDSYTEFAAIYDKFMENTPYDDWCNDIVENLKNYGIEDGLVCELGAGTGEMTRRLRDKGFDMIGIDNSGEMLAVAMAKERENSDILYLNQDMCDFELYGTVRAIVSVCDCVNYVLDDEEITRVFKLANNYLDPKGILIFDFNTRYKYKDVIGETVIAENREDESFIWENSYDEEDDINEYDITFFVREGNTEHFKRFTETHLQRGYTFEEMKKFIADGGLEFVRAYDADTKKEVTDISERIVMIARECGK